MSNVIALPPPPVVTQEPAHCWKAAYESWNEACHEHLGLPKGPNPDDMLRYLRRGRLLTRAGRATNDGVTLLGGAAVMCLRHFPANQVTGELFVTQLRYGYVFCAYYWRGRRGGQLGHAVVVYAAGPDRILYMDPDPNRGLRHAAPSQFARDIERVVLGVPMMTVLDEAIRSATAGLV